MLISSFSSSFRSKRKAHLKGGFTLIEVLVVISIMAILSAILVSYSRQNGQQLLLISAIAKVETLISRAKFISVQTFFEDQSGIICAHGVKVEKDEDSISIFKVEKDGNCPDPEGGYENLHINDDWKLSGELNNLELGESGIDIIDSFDYVVFVPPTP